MFLKSIKLTNFRNFRSQSLEFPGVTLLIGRNAQGKSTLLEAIYFLATTKSSRVERDSQLISRDEQVCRVEGAVQVDNDETTLEVVMSANSEGSEQNGFIKRLRVNGIERRALDYIGNLTVVLFSPEDIALIAGPPAIRRWHIDLTLAQIDREYKRAISEYTQVIVSRNRILKRVREGLSRYSELDFWTEKALALGLVITDKRSHLFGFLSSRSRSLNDFEYEYLPSLITPERLKECQDREIASATSLVGPHRDDFIFKLEGQNLAFFGSRGEQRTAVLDLKLLELEYIYHLRGTQPVLLLDDIFSELDEEHREHVVSIVANQQTIISAVDSEKIPDSLLQVATQFRVEGGKILVNLDLSADGNAQRYVTAGR